MLSDDELKRYRELLNAQNDSTYFKKEIGANLKNARANTPLTQEDVAEIFDCDPRKIRRYENGEVMCSLTQLISFCKVYKCTLEDLMPAETISYVSSLAGLDTEKLKSLMNVFRKTVGLKTAYVITYSQWLCHSWYYLPRDKYSLSVSLRYLEVL